MAKLTGKERLIATKGTGQRPITTGDIAKLFPDGGPFEIEDITGLEAALDDKADDSKVDALAVEDIGGLEDALNLKADQSAMEALAIEDIDGLEAALLLKADDSKVDTLAVADIDGLEAALTDKADDSALQALILRVEALELLHNGD